MGRAYYSRPINKFLDDNESYILGELSKFNQFSLEEQQRNAWLKQVRILKEQLKNFENGHIIFEYTIPRMGKRVDVVLIRESVVFVIEFKVNETEYLNYAIDQAVDYAIDLKNFQEGSHFITLVPILIATEAPEIENNFEKFSDKFVLATVPKTKTSPNSKNAPINAPSTKYLKIASTLFESSLL